MIQKPNRIWWIALIAAWFFDFLFWEKSAGISFTIFVGITLGGGFLLARWEQIAPARKSWVLLIPVAIFALGTFIRREPFTVVMNYLLTFFLMGLLASTFTGGRWVNYSLSDYVSNALKVIFGSLVDYPLLRSELKKKSESEDPPIEQAPARPEWKKALPALRGILMAIPVVAVFASLLASADPIFSDYLENFVDIFRIENLPEYIFRAIYILLFGYIIAGVYSHALTKSQDEKLIGEEKPWLKRLLGFTEAAIVLGSVVALFAIFVGIQFRYFFGGQTNIKIDGYTYAEYARRGFGELVVVALFSLFLLMGLSALTRREEASQRKIFSGLGAGLVILVAVILVSAFQRLLLYEAAYGFTRLRTYSHIFMVWLGLLLIAVVVLEFLQKQRAFALAILAASFGFVLSLNVLNVDGLIARQNIQRVINGSDLTVAQEGRYSGLDGFYLQSLSVDATPVLIQAQQDGRLNVEYRNEIAAVLACQLAITQAKENIPWQSFHWADSRALKLLLKNQDHFSDVRVYKNDYGSWWVEVNDKERPCRYDPFEYY